MGEISFQDGRNSPEHFLRPRLYAQLRYLTPAHPLERLEIFPCENTDFFPFLLRQIDDAHTGEWHMADKTHKENIFLDMTQAHVKESTGHRESLGQALNKG